MDCTTEGAEGLDSEFVCSASLISGNVVITADTAWSQSLIFEVIMYAKNIYRSF